MGKLRANQLIEKLIALLQEADQDNLDEVIEKVRKQLDDETARANREYLANLFNTQLTTLNDCYVPKQIVEILHNQKGAVLKKASEETHGDGNIPFLPVIPRTFRGPYDLITMVRNGGKVGYTCLNPTAIYDVVETPDEPYYIYNVEEDSNATRTAAEVMALTVHTDVLSKHSVRATGSRYESADKVPYVCLDSCGRPWLGWVGLGLCRPLAAQPL